MSGKEEEELAGGNVTRVARIEGNVHRDVGPWTPVVHALLAHLERAGFDGSPRVLGFDDDGREVLTYIEGEPGSLQFPRALLRADALTAFGRFIRAFHDAAAGFVPDPSAVYQRSAQRQLVQARSCATATSATGTPSGAVTTSSD